MVIAAPVIQADSRRREETGTSIPSGGRGKGVHGDGEEHNEKSEKRWLRRLAIGVSLAAFRPAPAAAELNPLPGADGGIDAAGSRQSRARTTDADRFTVGSRCCSRATAVRPDDRANRFAISDGASPATSSQSTHSSVSWDGAVTFGLGALVLVLALGLGISYIRRPRIAGL